MRPTSTTYRLARPGGEYNRLYALMEREGFGRMPLGWPVVVAERKGRVIGFLGTHPRKDAIVAGPLVVEGGRNMPMFIRLVDAYANVLRMAGVKSYFFGVAKGNSKAIERVQVLGATRIGEDEAEVWFQREA